jgi:acetylornithine deacetylase
MVPQFLKLHFTKSLHFAFSYDEEVGCLGARTLIADIKKEGISPSGCIVGEPTKCEPIIAHKGIQVFCCRFHGRATHSSLTREGCNAIEYAAKLISWLRELAESFKTELNDPNFDVPYTTLTTNMIHGGTAGNIIPSLCEFFFEFRQLPIVSADKIKNEIQKYIQAKLLPDMQKEFSDASIELLELEKVPSFEAKLDTPIAKLIESITQSSLNKKVSYATEAGLFTAAGIPTIICGPGSIVEAHRPNEFVSLEQIHRFEKFLYSLITKYNV